MEMSSFAVHEDPSNAGLERVDVVSFLLLANKLSHGGILLFCCVYLDGSKKEKKGKEIRLLILLFT